MGKPIYEICKTNCIGQYLCSAACFFVRMRMLTLIVCILICGPSVAQQTVGVFSNLPESFNGFTLLAPTPTDTVYLIDNCGHVVHKWVTEHRPGLATYLLNNGDILRTGRDPDKPFSSGGSGGIVKRYDWDSNLIWSYLATSDTLHQHHDIEPLPNGNVLILNWGLVSNAEAIAAGRNPANLNGVLWPTVITEVQPIFPEGGEVVWEWRLWDHLVQDFDAGSDNYGVIADHPELLDINYSTNGSTDFLHANAISYNQEFDQIAISSRKSSEIYVIDHSTTMAEAASHSGGIRGKGGDFLYRWGNPQTYGRGDGSDQILSATHDIHWIADSLMDGGKFMVFNNDGGSNGSAVNVFTPPTDGNGNYTDPGNGAFGPTTTDWHYEEPGFSSLTISGAQRLPNGNTLICEGSSGHLFEVTPNYSKVWDYINPAAINGNLAQGATATQNPVFRAYRFPVDHPAFAGRDLTPRGLIEIDTDPAPCEIIPEPLGSTSLETLEFRVYPNPTNGTVIINLPTTIRSKIKVYNALGKMVWSTWPNGKSTQLDTRYWESGIYLIRMGTGTARLMVN